jgi:methionyl aminopeptidase
MYTRIKTVDEISAMRESGRMLATVLELLRTKIAVGVTTKDLADIAKQEVKALGGQPSFLGYQGFKDVLCVSVNEEVVHGIPRADKVITDGDIVSMDFGVTYKGMITDAAISVIVGQGSEADKQLLTTAEAAMYAGIATLKDGIKIGTIGHAIEEVLNKAKYGIVRDLVGHGVGHELHEDPNIPNYGRANTGHSLEAGMTIAIEPMATRGTEKVYLSDDNWTIITRDHSRAAHFEHTILITETGSEILTTL